MPYKILADCHSHSNCSFDGEAPMEAMCARAEALGLDGTERYTVAPIDFSAGLPEPRVVGVTAERANGTTVAFEATVRVDTPTEGRYYANGGILPFVLRQLL